VSFSPYGVVLVLEPGMRFVACCFTRMVPQKNKSRKIWRRGIRNYRLGEGIGIQQQLQSRLGSLVYYDGTALGSGKLVRSFRVTSL